MTSLNVVEMNSEANVTKVLKRQPGLGKLNRMTKSAQSTIASNGHANKRFKRDYSTGVATYTCPNCSASAIAQVSQERGKSSVGGDALVMKCSVTNS
jgi:hypothetical protein